MKRVAAEYSGLFNFVMLCRKAKMTEMDDEKQVSIDKNMFHKKTSWNMTAELRPLTDVGNLMTYLIEQVELVNLPPYPKV